MATQNRMIRRFVAVTIALFIVFGIVADGPRSALEGFLRLQVAPARLVSDFTVVAGPGAVFLNSAAVGIAGLIVLRLNKVQLSGPTMATTFIMMGFALFGKTVLNIIPIILGVTLAALIVGRKPSTYVLIALFGTALAPLVSFIAFEMGFPFAIALPLSIAIGVLAGVILPPLAIAMLHLHQGYSLYNVGLTAGFIGLFAASLPNAASIDISAFTQWGTASTPLLIAIVPILSLVAIVMSLFGEGGIAKTMKQYLALLKLPGRLPSDFLDLAGEKGALFNAGTIGLAYSAFVALVGGSFNGPVVGALMTILGFGFFGKHLRNALPIFLGVLLAALVFGKDISQNWVIVAFLFSTGLSPLAGEFGTIVGMIAGFLLLVIVERTGSWHGGMNLYNVGFAGGLTATLLVSVIEWYKTNVQR